MSDKIANSSVYAPLEEEEWGMLAEDLKAGEYAFFIASGLSREAGLPTGTELAERMIQKLYPNTTDPIARFRRNFNYSGTLELPVVTHLIENRFGRRRLIRFVTSCTNWNVQPSYVHQFFRLLALEIRPRGKGMRIITPNYDNLLEHSLPPGSEVIVLPEQYNQVREPEPWVLKIHGCIRTQPIDTIRITTRDLSRRLEYWKRDATNVCLSRRGLIVIGYGATDIHVKRIINRAIRKADKEAYWISIGEPPRQIINSLSNKGGRYLQMDATTFFKKLGM